jgi:hypothetical protein
MQYLGKYENKLIFILYEGDKYRVSINFYDNIIGHKNGQEIYIYRLSTWKFKRLTEKFIDNKNPIYQKIIEFLKEEK